MKWNVIPTHWFMKERKPHIYLWIKFFYKTPFQETYFSVHEGIKAHKCPICDSRFSAKKLYKYFFYESHFGCKSQLSPYIEAVHKRKKPHICPICESSFSQKSNMKTHIASAHEMYESRFSAKSKLRNHIAVGVERKNEI